MNLDKFTGSGSTPSRRAFWDKVAEALLASQKREGRNASVQEHQGQGTVINFPDQTPSAPVTPTGACCVGTDCSITTESECDDMEGTYQGDGTDCDPNPCLTSCGGFTSFSADFVFTYQDSPTPPIGHAFSGSGTVTGSIDPVTCCSDANFTEVMVTVIEHGEFGDTTCEPDATVTLTASLCYDVDTDTWTVAAEVFLPDHAVECGPEGWPGISIVSSVADTGLGSHPLDPDTGPPSITGTVDFSVF